MICRIIIYFNSWLELFYLSISRVLLEVICGFRDVYDVIYKSQMVTVMSIYVYPFSLLVQFYTLILRSTINMFGDTVSTCLIIFSVLILCFHISWSMMCRLHRNSWTVFLKLFILGESLKQYSCLTEPRHKNHYIYSSRHIRMISNL